MGSQQCGSKDNNETVPVATSAIAKPTNLLMQSESSTDQDIDIKSSADSMPNPPLIRVSAIRHTAFPSVSHMTPTPEAHHKRIESFANVTNGITGTHISSSISKIAAKFWYKHVEVLGTEQRLELGCAIFFDAFSRSKEMRNIMTSRKNTTIEKKSLKYLDAIGWLLRNLLTDNINLYALLKNLGTLHQNMGVKIQHFYLLLQSISKTFSHYFPRGYSLKVKFSMDEIFIVVAQIMSGQDLSHSSHLNKIAEAKLCGQKISFLTNLRVCLQSVTGKEYFYQYLRQSFCEEIVFFMESISEFRAQSKCIQRFMLARGITRTCIDSEGEFALNISYEIRNKMINRMHKLETQYTTEKKLEIDIDFFDEVEEEIYRIILPGHWAKFKDNLETLHSKSCGY